MKTLRIRNIINLFLFHEYFISGAFVFNKDTSKIYGNIQVKADTEPILILDKSFENLYQVFTNFSPYKNIFKQTGEKYISKSMMYFLNVCYKYNFFNDNFATYDSELDDVIGNFIDLNSYTNNIGAFLKEVKYIYHTEQFKSVILCLEKILNIVTQFNDAIDKLNYGLLNLHSQLKFKNKEEIGNDEYHNRVLLLIIKLSFSLSQNIMKLFNEKMLDNKEKYL